MSEDRTGPVGNELEARKSALRRTVRRALAALSEQGRRDAAEAVGRRLEALAAEGAWRNVLIYMPLGREVDILPLARHLLARGAALFAPFTDIATGAIAPVSIESLEDHHFEIDALGVRSPRSRVPADPATLDAVLVPGVAFDAHGHRLGRGGGYYDRLLAALTPRTTTVGVCHECQVVETVPVAPHDVPVDLVVSDRRAIYTHARPRGDAPTPTPVPAPPDASMFDRGAGLAGAHERRKSPPAPGSGEGPESADPGGPGPVERTGLE